MEPYHRYSPSPKVHYLKEPVSFYQKLSAWRTLRHHRVKARASIVDCGDGVRRGIFSKVHYPEKSSRLFICWSHVALRVVDTFVPLFIMHKTKVSVSRVSFVLCPSLPVLILGLLSAKSDPVRQSRSRIDFYLGACSSLCVLRSEMLFNGV